MLLFLDIGGGEIFLILFVFLLLFGSDKIPEMARGLGKGIREFKDATNGIQQEITNSITTVKRETNISEEINSIKTHIDKMPEIPVESKPEDVSATKENDSKK